MPNPKIPPANRGYLQGYPGIPGKATRPDAHFAGSVIVTSAPKGMTVSWVRVELAKIETLPTNKSWTEYIGSEPVVIWRAADGHGAEETFLPLDRTTLEFEIPIPRYLPPSMQINKNSGIKYSIVATMAAKVRKGFIRKEDVQTTVETSCTVTIPKYEMLSSWPVFNSPEEYSAESSNFRLKLISNRVFYAIGETIALRAIVHSKLTVPKKLKSFKVSLIQTTTFNDGAAQTSKQLVLASKSHSVRKKIAGGDTFMRDLSLIVPKKRTLMDVKSAEHIDIEHSLTVELNCGGERLVADTVAVRITPFTEVASAAIKGRIGSDISLTYGGQAPQPADVADSAPIFVEDPAIQPEYTPSPTSSRVPRVFQEQDGYIDAAGVSDGSAANVPVRNQFMAPVTSGAYALPGSMRPGEVVRLERGASAASRPVSAVDYPGVQTPPANYRQSLPPHMFASESEKQRLFDNARSEARAYQAQFEGGATFAEDRTPQASNSAALAAATTALAPAAVVSERSRFPTAAEEKAAIYERAQQEVRSYYDSAPPAATEPVVQPVDAVASPSTDAYVPESAAATTFAAPEAAPEAVSEAAPTATTATTTSLPDAAAGPDVAAAPVSPTTARASSYYSAAPGFALGPVLTSPREERAPDYEAAGSSAYPSASEEKAAIYNRAQDEVRAFYARQLEEDLSAQHAEVRPIDVQIVEAAPLVAQSAEVEHADGEPSGSSGIAPPIMAVSGY
ncbi:hypothetical protein MCUN1_003805 [Malassezia cuniculi]|uniref:Arrestin C-terminal-like domain-containing protein n=1 Tax=Malassezia cuniculi TaxID=948313 RepID=A0AAF0J849_9BASI|nr:hypothetical protein MCUN1_003805 [Malassezia cuniculi]